MAAPLFLQPLFKYVDFKGRARRSEFWLWTLAQFILFAVIETILFSTMPRVGPNADPSLMMTHFMRFFPLLNLVQLGLFLPNLAVSVRRLHDSNRSGWWILMPFGVLVLGGVLFLITNMAKITGLMKTGANTDPSAIMGIVGSAMLFIYLPALIAGIVLLVFYCLDGTAGANRFGTDPKNRGNVNVF